MNFKRIIAIGIAMFVFAVVSWGWSVWVRIYEPLPIESKVGEDNPTHKESKTYRNTINILMLGIDQLANESARADSIIVLSINKDTEEVSLISIPRDSRVEIPGRGFEKINHAMAYRGGINLMVSTVEQLLGAPLHHYVYTNFEGFKKIVDIFGGITVDVQERMLYDDIYNPINIYPGRQLLNGAQALGYVRFRGGRGDDFGRMKRQQEFMKIVVAEVSDLKNILALPQLLEQAARHIRTDISIAQLLGFSHIVRNINPD